jgi:hypothetical protein
VVRGDVVATERPGSGGLGDQVFLNLIVGNAQKANGAV